MLSASRSEGNHALSNSRLHDREFPSGIGQARSRQQLGMESLLQQRDRAQVRDCLPVDDGQDRTVRNAGFTRYLPQAATPPLFPLPYCIPKCLREEPGIVGGNIVRQVSGQPILACSSELCGPDSLPPCHNPTVNQAGYRPLVPHNLVGAPADRHASSPSALHPPRQPYYYGLYIDQEVVAGVTGMTRLEPEEGILLADAVEAVLAYWQDSHVLTDKSFHKFEDLLHRYTKFATALRATTLAEQSEALAAQWISAKGRDRTGKIVSPAAATMNTRRSALRKFFRDAESLRLSASGLVVKAYVAPRQEGLTRPLTEDEARLLWLFADAPGPHTRRPVLFALMLSGVHSSEVGLVAVKDVDTANKRVWAHGETNRLRPRWVAIPEPYFAAVEERLTYLRTRLPSRDSLPDRLLTQTTSTRPMGYAQNRAAAACNEVFRQARSCRDHSFVCLPLRWRTTPA